MKQTNIEPNRETFTNLLLIHAKRGDLETILTLLERFNTEKVFLFDKDLLKVIYELSINGHTENIQQIIDYIRFSKGYNTEAYKTVLQLVNKGHDDVAYQILLTMKRPTLPSGELAETGRFFLVQTVKLDRPIEKILEVCQQFVENGLNSRPYVTLLHAVAKYKSNRFALDVIHKLQARSVILGEEHFVPLIQHASNRQNVLNVLATMNQLNVRIRIRLMQNHLINVLGTTSAEELIDVLAPANIPRANVIISLVLYHLNNNQLQAAAEIAAQYKMEIFANLFQSSLIASLIVTNDTDSCVKFLRNFYEQYDSKSEKSNAFSLDRSEALGMVVCKALQALARQSRLDTASDLLHGLVKEGVTISKNQEEQIRSMLDADSIEHLSEKLSQLSSGELNFQSNNKRPEFRRFLKPTDLKNLINQTDDAEEKVDLKIQLLEWYYRNENFAEFEEHFQVLENEKIPISNRPWAKLIRLQVDANEPVKAWCSFEKAQRDQPDFKLTSDRLIANFVTVLVRNNQIDEAVKILELSKRESAILNERNMLTAQYAELMHELSENKNLEHLTKLFDSLITNNVLSPKDIEIRNVQLQLLRPLVRVHLNNNDIDKAIDTLEDISVKYKCVPSGAALNRKLIENQDFVNFERVTKICSKVYGKKKSLIKAVNSLIECGELQRARKIILNNINFLGERDLETLFKGFALNKRFDCIKTFFDITNGLNNVARESIWNTLLDVYCTNESPKQALDLWVQMQEENHVPTEAFLHKLGTFLNANNLEVPFAIPKEATFESKTPRQTTANSYKPITSNQSEAVANLRAALKTNNIKLILDAYGKLGATDRTNLHMNVSILQKLFNANALDDFQKFLIKLVQQKQIIQYAVVRPYLREIAKNGNIQAFDELKKLDMTIEVLQAIRFNNCRIDAYVTANQIDGIIDNVTKKLETAQTDEDFDRLAIELPPGKYVKILEANPELLPKRK